MSENVVTGHRIWGLPSVSRVSVLLLSLVCLLSFGAGFNTRVLDFPWRMLFWTVAITLIVGQCHLLWRGLMRFLPATERARFAGGVLAALIATAAFTLELNILKSLELSPVPPQGFWHSMSHFAVPSVAVCLLFAYIARLPPLAPWSAAQPVSVEETATSAIAWPRYVPEWIRAQDHYLELRHDGRSQLLRARMRDALEHFSSQQGIRVHRSWWVRKGLPASLQRAGRDMVMVTRNGERIPVSRSRQSDVRQLWGRARSSSS